MVSIWYFCKILKFVSIAIMHLLYDRCAVKIYYSLSSFTLCWGSDALFCLLTFKLSYLDKNLLSVFCNQFVMILLRRCCDATSTTIRVDFRRVYDAIFWYRHLNAKCTNCWSLLTESILWILMGALNEASPILY